MCTTEVMRFGWCAVWLPTHAVYMPQQLMQWMPCIIHGGCTTLCGFFALYLDSVSHMHDNCTMLNLPWISRERLSWRGISEKWRIVTGLAAYSAIVAAQWTLAYFQQSHFPQARYHHWLITGVEGCSKVRNTVTNAVSWLPLPCVQLLVQNLMLLSQANGPLESGRPFKG